MKPRDTRRLHQQSIHSVKTVKSSYRARSTLEYKYKPNLTISLQFLLKSQVFFDYFIFTNCLLSRTTTQIDPCDRTCALNYSFIICECFKLTHTLIQIQIKLQNCIRLIIQLLQSLVVTTESHICKYSKVFRDYSRNTSSAIRLNRSLFIYNI